MYKILIEYNFMGDKFLKESIAYSKIGDDKFQASHIKDVANIALTTPDVPDWIPEARERILYNLERIPTKIFLDGLRRHGNYGFQEWDNDRSSWIRLYIMRV